jgi:hypothetical protein
MLVRLPVPSYYQGRFLGKIKRNIPLIFLGDSLRSTDNVIRIMKFLLSRC